MLVLHSKPNLPKGREHSNPVMAYEHFLLLRCRSLLLDPRQSISRSEHMIDKNQDDEGYEVRNLPRFRNQAA